MSLEILGQLEAKIQQLLDNVALLQMELEEEQTRNQTASAQSEALQQEIADLKITNEQLRQEHTQWQTRLQELLSKID